MKSKPKKTADVPRQISVLGLPYAMLGADAAARHIEARAVRVGRLTVFTPGATVASLALRDGTVFSLLRSADLLLADGCGISLAARLCGGGAISRCPGIEVGERLLALAAARGARVYFYGGEEGVAARAAAVWQARFPSLTIRAHSGYGAEPIADILAFAPDYLFVCLGAPRQEAFIAAHPEITAACLGLGGAFDVWSGKVRRAPALWRRWHLEWAWRVLCEPRRLGRLLPLPRYFLACLGQGIGQFIQKRKKANGRYGIM